jgi:cold shock CspA family protein
MRGKIIRFDYEKGFGFIVCDEGGDVFVRMKQASSAACSASGVYSRA